jgi:hypothetical protein
LNEGIDGRKQLKEGRKEEQKELKEGIEGGN